MKLPVIYSKHESILVADRSTPVEKARHCLSSKTIRWARGGSCNAVELPFVHLAHAGKAIDRYMKKRADTPWISR